MGNIAKGVLKTIDSFHIGSRIAPNMVYPFAFPRTRRPKPTSLGEGWVSFVWMMER